MCSLRKVEAELGPVVVSYRVTAACLAYMERITSREAYRAGVAANGPGSS
jgi:hypothetical protein